MSKKNYRTLDGLYKAILKRKTHVATDYTFLKNDEDIIIFNSDYPHGGVSGVLIEDLMPVLKRSCWMIRHNLLLDRIELTIWICNDNV